MADRVRSLLGGHPRLYGVARAPDRGMRRAVRAGRRGAALAGRRLRRSIGEGLRPLRARAEVRRWERAGGEIDTPIAAELGTVLGHPFGGHIVLIDDARDFTRANGYPTIEALRCAILDRCPDWLVEVCDDAIRAHARPTRI